MRNIPKHPVITSLIFITYLFEYAHTHAQFISIFVTSTAPLHVSLQLPVLTFSSRLLFFSNKIRRKGKRNHQKKKKRTLGRRANARNITALETLYGDNLHY